MKDIAIFGAGGFGREVACLIKRINEKEPTWNFIGFFDDNAELKGTRNEYGEVLGGMKELNAWEKELGLVVTIGVPQVLSIVVSKIQNDKITFPNLIDPTVDFLDPKNVKMGKGNVICAKSFVSCNVIMGDFNLYNVGVGIGHDSSLGNYNVIMPNVNISGGVQINNCNMLGVKSTVLQYLKIGSNVKFGANSLLMRNAKDNNLYIGNPAKKIEI